MITKEKIKLVLENLKYSHESMTSEGYERYRDEAITILKDALDADGDAKSEASVKLIKAILLWRS